MDNQFTVTCPIISGSVTTDFSTVLVSATPQKQPSHNMETPMPSSACHAQSNIKGTGYTW